MAHVGNWAEFSRVSSNSFEEGTTVLDVLAVIGRDS